jgi:hypothetical protein
MVEILRTPLPVSGDRKNELQPFVLNMSNEAAALWLGFADAIERELGPDGSLHSAVALLNKLPEQAARLAGVLVLWDTKLQAREISADYMNTVGLSRFPGVRPSAANAVGSPGRS